jgi:hypothetical protein
VRRADHQSSGAAAEKYRELKQSLGLDQIATDRVLAAHSDESAS